MHKRDVKNELYAIAKLYPTLLGMMQKELGSGTVGDHWSQMICEQCTSKTYFEDVCETYASGRRDLPKPTDQLCREIIKEVRQKEWEDTLRMESYATQVAGRRTDANRIVENDPIGSIAARYLFGKVRSGKHTAEENARMLDELLEFGYRSGPKPDWLRTKQVDAAAS